MLSLNAKALLAAVTILYALASASSAHGRCAGYSYAGVRGAERVAGVAARITPLTAFDVRDGHVASYVGVGGVEQGPNGSTEWIQAGMSAFSGLAGHSIYYEVARPGGTPTYRSVRTSVPSGETHRVAVLEIAKRRNWWRVWIDGHPVSKPILLPGSHLRWRPVATAENWSAAAAHCNTYAYRFEHVSVARTPGGAWTRLARGVVFFDPGYSVVHHTLADFVSARSRLSERLPRRQILNVRG